MLGVWLQHPQCWDRQRHCEVISHFHCNFVNLTFLGSGSGGSQVLVSNTFCSRFWNQKYWRASYSVCFSETSNFLNPVTKRGLLCLFPWEHLCVKSLQDKYGKSYSLFWHFQVQRDCSCTTQLHSCFSAALLRLIVVSTIVVNTKGRMQWQISQFIIASCGLLV